MPAFTGKFFVNDAGFGQATPITVAYSGVTKGNAIMVVAIEEGVGVTFSTCSDVPNGAYTNEMNLFAGSPAGTTATWIASNITATAGTITVPFTGGPGGQMFLFAFEISLYSAYDHGNADANFSSGPADTNGFTLTQNNDIIILCVVGQDNSTYSDPVGYTVITKVDDSTWRYQLYWKLSGSGPQAPTSTMTASASWVMVGSGLHGPLPFGGCTYEC